MSGMYGSMLFFMLVPNIASKIRKKMKKIVKYVKYSNQSRKLKKWVGIFILWPIKLSF
jgi:hypothetical protein